MARRIFYPKEEILSKDFNILRNDYEKLVLERFLGKAVPRIPAFIGGGFKPSLAGNQVNVAPGIGLQRVAQTDGSSEIRLMALDAEQTMSFVLPAAGQTKKALVQCRSRIVNATTENRNFKVGAAVVDRSTLVANRWSAEVAVKDAVVANAGGNYVADVGWVPVCVVSLNSSGITSIDDIRDFYNLFDPDFFSVYGRKNISFQRPWDGVTLVEVPFEFSDLVPKLAQVSVRRVTKERFQHRVNSTKFTANFVFTAPVAAIPALDPARRPRFLGSPPPQNLPQYQVRSKSNYDDYRELIFRGNWSSSNSYNPQSHIDMKIYTTPGRYYSGTRHIQDTLVFGRLRNISANQFSSIPSTGIYLWGRNLSGTQNMIWRYPKSRLWFRANIDFLTETAGGALGPVYKDVSNWSTNMNYFILSTENPQSTPSPGERRYVSTNDISIRNFYTLDEFFYDPEIQQIKFTLKNPKGTDSEFPFQGNVFDNAIIKHGSETRLRLSFSDFTVALRADAGNAGNYYADYTYNLTSQDTLIKDADSNRNFSVEFEQLETTGEDIWRANKMRGGSVLSSTVDFKLEEEGLRTYVRLNDQYPFKIDDRLIFSHIIPQELIDAGSGGTPEDQDVATQIAALQATLASLQRDVATNKGDIDTLENASAAGDVSFYHGIVSIAGGRSATARGVAKDIAQLTPLVGADMANPSERTLKTVSSLVLGGGLVRYNASAQVGYYNPWVAIETTDIGSKSLNVVGPGGFESDLWRPASNVNVDNKNYTLYVRIQPLINGKSLSVVFKLYE